MNNNQMSKKEMVEYLKSALMEEELLMLAGKENNYSFLFMICNDMGITQG